MCWPEFVVRHLSLQRAGRVLLDMPLMTAKENLARADQQKSRQWIEALAAEA